MLTNASASAQVPAEIEQTLREIGPIIDPERTFGLYGPLHSMPPERDLRVERDLAYGPHDRHRLDVAIPLAAHESRPLLLFVHGGGFVSGDKRVPNSPFYENIMCWAARTGMVGANATYRLAPAHPWPAGAEDVAAAVAWMRAHAPQYRGNPDKLFLFGHSAGAFHVADYLASERFHRSDGDGVAGAILVSGVFDPSKPPGANRAYFGHDRSKFAERSTLSGMSRVQTPLLVVTAELDPPAFIAQGEALNQTMCGAGRCPTMLRLTNHSHMSEVLSIGTPDTSLSDAILAFVRSEK